MTRRCRPSLITSVLLVLALGEVQHAAPAAAQKSPPTVVYRSESFERTTGQPNAFRVTFPACDTTSVPSAKSC